MVLWGGLRPIPLQLFIDVLVLAGFTVATFTEPDAKNFVILAISALASILLRGDFTNRWTIHFPMIPFLILQFIRRLKVVQETPWASILILVLSFVLLVIAVAWTILFPAVEIPPLEDAPNHVGVADVFLPKGFQFTPSIPDTVNICPSEQDHISVRLFYPTNETQSLVPHFQPELSEVFCQETMIAGAPPFLKSFGWMLHSWRLSRISAKPHAQPIIKSCNSDKMPIVIFSHGLGGNADLYTYQTRSLAAHGYLVVAINHSDGSAPVVARKDGTILRRNDGNIEVDWQSGHYEEYRKGRRVMTEYRTEEFLATVAAIIDLNEINIPELDKVKVSFVGKLNTQEIHYIGHSFGGATAFHASRRRPPTSIVSHETVPDWIPDGTRATLFDKNRLVGSQLDYSFWEVDTMGDGLSTSVHDQNMLILFSHEWEKKQWGAVEVLADMEKRGVLGPKGGISHVAVIDGAHHNEFSDTCMLTPVWLARATGITGTKSPLETARDIHEQTLKFLKDNAIPSKDLEQGKPTKAEEWVNLKSTVSEEESV